MNCSMLLPVYAELRSGGMERFYAQLRKVKLVLCTQYAPIIFVFAQFGPDVVTLLYDPR
jgi:hypothetical protein